MARYLAVFSAAGHEARHENVAPGAGRLAVLTHSGRDRSRQLAAFWLLAVAGLRSYLRCARRLGAK
jgi:hypothetical protein